MTRAHLPNRRPNTTLDLEHKVPTFNVSIGFDPRTALRRLIDPDATEAARAELRRQIEAHMRAIPVWIATGGGAAMQATAPKDTADVGKDAG